jgi:hypothetical protein
VNATTNFFKLDQCVTNVFLYTEATYIRHLAKTYYASRATSPLIPYLDFGNIYSTLIHSISLIYDTLSGALVFFLHKQKSDHKCRGSLTPTLPKNLEKMKRRKISHLHFTILVEFLFALLHFILFLKNFLKLDKRSSYLIEEYSTFVKRGKILHTVAVLRHNKKIFEAHFSQPHTYSYFFSL